MITLRDFHSDSFFHLGCKVSELPACRKRFLRGGKVQLHFSTRPLETQLKSLSRKAHGVRGERFLVSVPNTNSFLCLPVALLWQALSAVSAVNLSLGFQSCF